MFTGSITALKNNSRLSKSSAATTRETSQTIGWSKWAPMRSGGPEIWELTPTASAKTTVGSRGRGSTVYSIVLQLPRAAPNRWLAYRPHADHLTPRVPTPQQQDTPARRRNRQPSVRPWRGCSRARSVASPRRCEIVERRSSLFSHTKTRCGMIRKSSLGLDRAELL